MYPPHDIVIFLSISNKCKFKITSQNDYWYILLQTKTRIMTITQHNSVLHAFSVPNWSEICRVVDVLTVPRLLPTGKFRSIHDDVIKWKHFPRNWPFVRGIHRSPVNSPHKGQWRGALMFSLIYVWINGWVNNCEAGDLRRYRAH